MCTYLQAIKGMDTKKDPLVIFTVRKSPALLKDVSGNVFLKNAVPHGTVCILNGVKCVKGYSTAFRCSTFLAVKD